MQLFNMQLFNVAWSPVTLSNPAERITGATCTGDGAATTFPVTVRSGISVQRVTAARVQDQADR